jgi:hypothetical protein
MQLSEETLPAEVFFRSTSSITLVFDKEGKDGAARELCLNKTDFFKENVSAGFSFFWVIV